jgi:hypothetical protein
MSRNQKIMEYNYLQTELDKEPNMTKENNQKLLNIINNKNHVTELGQKYLKAYRKVKNNRQNFANIKTSQKINLNSNVMKNRMNKNQSSLLKNNSNTDSKTKIETSILVPNNEISNIIKEKIKDNCENETIQKRIELFTPIKVNKVKDKIFKSFKLKPIKSKILFNNVKKCSNNSRNSKNDQSLSRSSKKMVVMKIIRNNSNINSSCLNTENKFSVTYNSTKLNRNSEDFDNDTQTKFFATSQILLNKDYISAS